MMYAVEMERVNENVIAGGKSSLPAGLPHHFYQGFQGCIKRIRVFRRTLDLIRGGKGHSNLQLCNSSRRR